jgi:hypothetical protein
LAGASAPITNCAVGPQHDVDALAGELAGDRLHARAAHPDAGADRVDAAILREDRDLRAHARIPRGGLDLEQPLLDLGHLHREQVLDELGRSARQDQLRAAALAIHPQHVGADAVADAQVLLRDHLVARQPGLDLAGLDDRALSIHPLDGAGHDRLAALQEVGDDLLALRVADALQDHLLGGLRADAPELDRLELLLDEVADLHVGDLLLGLAQDDLQVVVLQLAVGDDLPAAEGLVVAAHAVDRHARVDLLLEELLGRGRQCALERLEHHFARDVLLPRERVDQQEDFTAHRQIS